MNFDDRMRRMAGEERMVLPAGLENRIEKVLEQKQSQSVRGVVHFRIGRAVTLTAAGVMLLSVTVSASVGLYRQRMEAMNHEKLEEYYTQLQQAPVGADSQNRSLTEEERVRLRELTASYREMGTFPKGELTMLDTPEAYKDGVGFFAATSTFFFPEKEMSDEELLQYIDFIEKRDYSLITINQEIEAGEYVYEPQKTESAATATDRRVPDSDAVYEPDREFTIAYEGDMGVECMAAGVNALYLGGYDRIERMEIGSGEAQLFFDDFGGDQILVNSLYEAVDGSVYAGISRLSGGQSVAFGKTEVYHISADGKLLNSFAVGDREKNLIDSIATDDNGRLYVHTRMREEQTGASVLIYDGQGQRISSVQETDYMIPESAGLGRGKDGAVYVSVCPKDVPGTGLAKLEPETGTMSAVYADLQTEGNNLVWDVVCQGVDTDFIVWGYDGVYTYNIGDGKAVRRIAPYEAVCEFEGACVEVLSDGRVVFLNATEGVKVTLENGAQTWVKNAEKTTVYYVPTME